MLEQLVHGHIYWDEAVSKQAAAEFAQFKEAERLLNLAISIMSFEDLGKIPGIRQWLEKSKCKP